jgi:hypothetical protein
MEEEGSKGLIEEQHHPEDLEYFILSDDIHNILESEKSEEFKNEYCQKIDVVSCQQGEVEPLPMVYSTQNLSLSENEDETSNNIRNDTLDCIDGLEHWVGDTQACASENYNSTMEDGQSIMKQRMEQSHSGIDSYSPSFPEAIPRRIPRCVYWIVLLVSLMALRHGFLASNTMPTENVCGVQRSNNNQKLQQLSSSDNPMDLSTRYKYLMETIIDKLDTTVKLIQKQESEIRNLQTGFQRIVQKYSQMEKELYGEQTERKKERERQRQLQKILQKQYEGLKRPFKRERRMEKECTKSQDLFQKVTKLKKKINVERKQRRRLQKLLRKEKSKRRTERKKRRRLEKRLLQKCNIKRR